VKEHWHSALDEIILLELPRAGSLPQMRLTGMLVGINLALQSAKNCRVTHLNGDGELGPSFEVVRKHIRLAHSRRVAVGAINDVSAIGALRALEEGGRAETCAIMGQNASPEGRAELRQPRTRFVGSVAYFHERYGENLIRVSLDILNHRRVPPAVFLEHKLVTPASVDHYYPNDALATLAQRAGTPRLVSATSCTLTERLVPLGKGNPWGSTFCRSDEGVIMVSQLP
jgi:ribose transport system substrate-binding protein